MKHPKKNRLRFWVYWNGSHARLTVHEGQEVVLFHGEPTEEGWHSDLESYCLSGDGLFLLCTDVSDGRDCDGRLTNTTEHRVPITFGPAMRGVDTVQMDGSCCPEVSVPKWERVHGEVYDEFAQAAGY